MACINAVIYCTINAVNTTGNKGGANMLKEILLASDKELTAQALALANDKEGTMEEYGLENDHDFYVFMFGYMKKHLEYLYADLS